MLALRSLSIRLIAAAMIIGVSHAGANTLEGKVVGITDGDTITVLIDRHEIKIRVAGIDAPEKRQPFGQRSKEHLSDCAFGKSVAIEWSKTDRYGRTIGKVLSSGVDCGLRQIQDGMAWHYKAYAKEQTAKDRAAYSEAESQARASKAGLWSDLHSTPPWEFRHQ